MNLTIIARADLTGLGVQSRNWVRLLKPNKVVVIDSTPFNGNEQHPEWYASVNEKVMVNGFIEPTHFDSILENTEVLLTFEIPYNYELFTEARKKGVKTVLQNNWEFTDYLLRDLPLPDILMNHSYWNLNEQLQRWPGRADYCPSPVFIDDFAGNAFANFDRKGMRRFLHIAGRKTHEDRNGTNDLLKAVQLIPKNIPFELVIKTQTTPVEMIDDTRIIIDTNSPVNEIDLYHGFDAMILPRRYGGACLPMTEALASALPVLMTNIDPNNKVLPNYWLSPATKSTTFMARTEVVVYSVDHQDLADKITRMAVSDNQFIQAWKTEARLIAKKEFAHNIVWDKWEKILKRLGV